MKKYIIIALMLGILAVTPVLAQALPSLPATATPAEQQTYLIQLIQLLIQLQAQLLQLLQQRAGSQNIVYLTPTTSAAAPTVNISGQLATLGQAIMRGNQTTAYQSTFSFTLLNPGSQSVYLPRDPGQLLRLSSTVASSSINFIAALSPTALTGDTATFFVIPAGSSRTFSLSGLLMSPAGGGYSTLKINQINYSLVSTSLLGSAITSGLDRLSVSVFFPSSGSTTVTPSSSGVGSIGPSLLSSAKVGQMYNAALTIFDVIDSNISTWSVSGNLPPGIQFQKDSNDAARAFIFGIPTTAGDYNFSVQVETKSHELTTKNYILKVVTASTLTPIINVFSVSKPITTTPGSATLTWKAVNASYCTLYGPNFLNNPRQTTVGDIDTGSLAVTGNYTLSCYDDLGQVASKALTVKVPTQASGPTTPAITVLSPNGGENLTVGVPFPISWRTSGDGFSKVIIVIQRYDDPLNPGNGITVDTINTTNSGSYLWTPKNYPCNSGPCLTDGTQFKVLVLSTSYQTANLYDTSDNYFSVTSALASVPTVSNPSVTLGQAIVNNLNNQITGYQAAFSFTFNNPSSSLLYVSSDSVRALGVTATVASSTLASLSANPQTIVGDTVAAYLIPAGAWRTFTARGVLSAPAGGGSLSSLRISKISYGSTPNFPTESAITNGLDNLINQRIF